MIGVNNLHFGCSKSALKKKDKKDNIIFKPEKIYKTVGVHTQTISNLFQ